ncbi:MAG: cytochrome c [Myxococcales bacterium]|nr:cytochrome c [Myxococcales bacterium]MCB9750851.1 cytochrome c [Myxococcales bacterium]
MIAAAALVGAAACDSDDVLAEIAKKAENNAGGDAESSAEPSADAVGEDSADAGEVEAVAKPDAGAEAATPPADSEAPPDGGDDSGGGEVGAFERSEPEFHATLAKLDAASACKKHLEGATEARVTVTIEANGAVAHVRAKPPVEGTPLGDCLEKTIKPARFVPAKALQMHEHTYKFRADGSSNDAAARKPSKGTTKIPEKRSDKEFVAKLRRLDAAAKCKQHVTAAVEARVTIVVDADGKVTHARTQPPANGTPLGDCLESKILTVTFTPAEKLQMHWHTYKFEADGTATDAASKKSEKKTDGGGGGSSGGPSAAEGKPIYMSKCKSCHGADGEAKTSMGEKLGIPPLKKTPKSKISKIISNGVAGTKMKAFKGKLTDDEIAAVTAFVKSL